MDYLIVFKEIFNNYKCPCHKTLPNQYGWTSLTEVLACQFVIRDFRSWKTLSVASECRKTHLGPIEFQPSDSPRGTRALPILCLDVKPSCSPVQNLNETPGLSFTATCHHDNLSACQWAHHQCQSDRHEMFDKRIWPNTRQQHYND